MKTIVLVSCVKQKLNRPARAEVLYTSSLFQKSMAYARSLKPDAVFILSAKYGLLPLDTIIEPYDLTLNTMSVSYRKEWAQQVIQELKKVSSLDGDRFVFLAGLRYREFLLPHLKHVQVPLEGVVFGKQLHQLDEWLNHE